MMGTRPRVGVRHAGPEHALPDAGQVKALLLESLEIETGDSQQRCSVKGPLHDFENSLLFRAENIDLGSDELPSQVAIKLCLDSPDRIPSPIAAITEAEALRQVYAHLAPDSCYRVPRPFSILTGHGFVVTEWIDGRSLTRHCLDWRCSPREVCDLIRRAGIWLRRFHDCRVLSDGPIEIDRILSGIEETFEEAAPSFATDLVARTGANLLAETAGSISGIPLARSWLHGDFKADNLLISGQHLVGIDIHLAFENVVVNDLAQFLNHFELLICHPQGWRLVPLRHAIVNACIEGYVGEGPAIPRRALAWVRLSAVLNLWANRAPAWVSPQKRWFLSRCFRRLTRRIQAELTMEKA